MLLRGHLSWRTWWRFKEVVLTVIGVAVILSQVFSSEPSDVLLTAGLLMAGLSASVHLGGIFSLDIKRGNEDKSREKGNGDSG